MLHPGSEQALRIQLATALRERDTALAQETYWHARATEARDERERAREQKEAAEAERDALRTALQDIVTLCMDVADTPDWRKAVGDKAREALFGEPGWKET